MSLTFDAERHEYRLGGAVVPSVTQVIGAVLPGWQATEWHMRRGLATHHGCRLLDEGRLDWSSVSPEIEPRIRAWEKFRAELPGQVSACERPMASGSLRYAGMLDRVIVHAGENVLADLKNSIAPQVRVQLGGYSLLWSELGLPKIHCAVAVELREDGSYSTLWLDTRELRLAEQTFVATLTVFNFMQRHNLKGGTNGR